MKPITTPTEIKRDGMNSYQIESFTEVRDVPDGIPWNVFTELWDDVLKKGISIPAFDNKRNILHGFYLDYVCIEYTDASIREMDKANNESLYKITDVGYPFTWEVHDRYQFTPWWHSKPQDEQGRQIARNVWEFEYNGKYYLVVSPRNTPLSDEITPEKWIFKGIIVNRNDYNWISSSTIQWEISGVRAQVQNLTENPDS